MFGMIVEQHRVKVNCINQRCGRCKHLFVPGDFVGWDALMNVCCNRAPGGKPFCQRAMEEKMEGKRFWLVWCPSAANPSCRHGSRELAQAEAVRLARANPSKEFFVTEVIERVVVEPIQPTIEHLR